MPVELAKHVNSFFSAYWPIYLLFWTEKGQPIGITDCKWSWTKNIQVFMLSLLNSRKEQNWQKEEASGRRIVCFASNYEDYNESNDILT